MRGGLRGGSGPSRRSTDGAEEESELAVLERLRARLAGRARPRELHLGDDAAVLVPTVGRLLVSTDMLVEGVHFDLGLGTATDAGWKAIAVNVSDIAAMGGIATSVVAAVASPGGRDLDALFTGIIEASDAYGVALVGGDLSQASELVVSIAILGETGEREPVTRSGARPGDELWCTGPLGSSAAGLAELRSGSAASNEAAPHATAYLRPVARSSEGRLCAELEATAMIDVSDGLAIDVRRVAEASGVGIALDVVPTADGCSESQALGGGEDYELVFAAPRGKPVEAAFRERGLRAPQRIGTCVEDPSVFSLRGAALAASGFVHRL